MQGGETLASVAAALWGDSSLWFRIAEANGLSAGSALVAGQRLTIPTGVARSTYNASTFQPYDPAATLGDTSPTTPTPQAQPRAKQGCGVLGAILIAVVSIAVSVALPQLSPFFKTFAGQVLGGLLANAVGQGVGIATGIQDRFDFKGLAMAGVTSAITAGLGGELKSLGGKSVFDKVGIGTGVAGSAARAAISGVLGEGIGVATGLKSRFDFAGVAAAGVGAAAGARFGGEGLGREIRGIGADALASAASRAVLTGTSFGDNIIAVLPGVVARTIGRVAEDAIRRDQISKQQVPVRTEEGVSAKLAPSGEWYLLGAPGSSETVLTPEARISLLEYGGTITKETAADLRNRAESIKMELRDAYQATLTGKSQYVELKGHGFAIDHGTLSNWKAGWAPFFQENPQHPDKVPFENAVTTNARLIDQWDRIADAELASLADYGLQYGEYVPGVGTGATGLRVLMGTESAAEAGTNMALGIAGGKLVGLGFKGLALGAKPLAAMLPGVKVAAETAPLRAGEVFGPPSFSPGTGKSYFWSGLGPGGANTAGGVARSGGGTTLEMFIESRGIQMPVWDAANPASIKAWNDVSRVYASGASGEVRAVLGNNLRPGNTWQSVELPALQANPNVTRIITVNPTTKAETVFWSR